MNAFDAALQSRLTGGTALTALLGAGTASIYHLQAPEGAVLPYVVYGWQGGGDENLSAHRVKDGIEFVRGYSGVSAAQAGSIDAQIDSLLHLNPLTVTGWGNLWLAREQDLETVETLPNRSLVWMAGGFYRVLLEKT